MIPTCYDRAWDAMINDRSKESQLLLGLLAILMLVISVVLFAQQTPLTNSDISKRQTEGFAPQDRFITSYITHSPITITSNADFVSQGFPGSGTPEVPYVIAGYNITTTGACIFIQDTDAYFVIRDCLLTGGSSGKGVRLDGVDHGEIRNNNISGIDDCGVYLRYSMGNTVVNNTMSGNNNSVFIVFSSSNNTVVNNTISGSYRFGVFIGYSSNNNTVVNNTISGNEEGVSVTSSSNNTVLNNTISGNNYGVYLHTSSDNNLIYLNIIADNNNGNARDYGTGNHWNSTATGNYWSDYAGTGVYHIPGSAESIDYYPFVFPRETTPPTIDHPADMDFEEGTTGNTIEWNPSDAHASHHVVYRNGTEVASDSWDGSSISVEVDGLGVGVYNYTIVVYDTSGNYASDTVFVTVLPPASSSITTTTDTTTTTTTSGDVTDLVILFLGVGGIGVVIVVLILMKYRRGS